MNQGRTMKKISGLLEVVSGRRSVRNFQDRPVEKEKILLCLEAARMAPSAENKQPWRFLVLTEAQTKDEFGKAAFSGIYRATRWALEAPVLVVLMTELDLSVYRIGALVQTIPFHVLDIGIAGEHLVLQAQHLGLGTCWIGWFDVRKASRFLRIPRSFRICGLIALGYPDSGRKIRERSFKSVDQVVRFDRWGTRD
jgi:nitroreductase